jgi:polar amino acid transport system substrate-binding protein
VSRRPSLTCAATRLTAALVPALIALAACSSSSSGGDPSTVSAGGAVDSALAAKVPATVKADGVVKVGTDSTYAPSEFVAADGHTIQGFDVDLFTAVAAKLGLKAQFVTAPFGTIVQSVQSGKFEVGVSSFTLNAAREKQATMVSYFSAGTLWASAAGNPKGVAPDNACGKRVAVQANTVQVDDLAKRTKACTSAGKPAITVDQYTGQDQATASVVSKKDDAMLADSPVIAYAVKQTNGQLAVLGSIYDSAPYGYVLPKTQTGFGDAIVGALKALMADGTYKKILDKWGVSQGAITNPQVNPTVS